MIKFLKKRLMAAALAVGVLLTSSACSAQTEQKTQYITEITVEQVQSENVSYSQTAKTYAVNKLEKSLSSVLATVYGSSASTLTQNYSDSVLQIVESFEARRISESNLTLIVDKLCAEEDLLVSLISDDQPQIYAALQLFSEISGIAGTDTACLLVYDFSLIYCNHYIAQYNDLYRQYGYPYQLRYAQEWEERYAEIQTIGEQNFLNLLKISVSALSVRAENADSVQSLISGFSAGEGALYLRAQGFMIQKLTLNSDNWNFIFTALGESGYSQKVSAVCATDDLSALSAAFPQFISDLSYALTKTDSGCVQSLKEGNYSAFLYKLFLNWTDENWNNFASLLSGLCGDYGQYFTDNGVLEQYSQFESQITPITLTQLKNSSQDEFYNNLINFVATYSAQFAFVLFEL